MLASMSGMSIFCATICIVLILIICKLVHTESKIFDLEIDNKIYFNRLNAISRKICLLEKYLDIYVKNEEKYCKYKKGDK